MPDVLAPSVRPPGARLEVALAENLSPAGELGRVDERAGHLQGEEVKKGVHVISVRCMDVAGRLSPLHAGCVSPCAR